MNISEKHLRVDKTARYFSNEPSAKLIKNFWFVLHGYAQLASDFIKEFDFLDKENTLIVAPEGLSRLHTKDKIGASWMTREDRMNEIKDYLNYLDMLLAKLDSEYDLASAKSNLLGFSQGVHTAMRLFLYSDFYFNNLILTSSDLPKDADYEMLRKKLVKSKLYYLSGKEDKIVNLITFEKNKKLLVESGVKFEAIVFDGQHEIDTASLKYILNNKD